MTDVVVAEDVSKRFGDTAALDGVSLSVAAGDVFALVGPNGAGKTTLVRCLTGTTDPDGGRVALLGGPPGDAVKSRVGLLPQDFRPAGRLTPAELVAYYAGLYDEARDPEAALREVGVDPGTGARFEDLSGGQQRRVCVAAALVNDPDVLFVDEPTTGVDPAGRRALWRLFEDLADAGTTVFLTTHYMAEAERLADTVGLLADGDLVEAGAPADLVARHGGRSRVVVETDADADAFADAPLSPVAVDGDLVFEGVPPERIGDVVDAFEDRGLAFESLTWTEPDLEDVYLRLAGEAELGDGSDALAEGVAP